MENLKGFFDSFKEFIWDIIGYLLPGSYVIILLSICINSSFFLNTTLSCEQNESYNFVFIIVSYVIGYVVYGIGVFKERILGKYSYIKKTEESVSKRPAFNSAKQLISKAYQNKGVTTDLTYASVRDLRSITMGFIPEQDYKIYTFTFRADISNHTGFMSLIIGVLGLLFSIFNSIPLTIFKTSTTYVLFYICLIICYLFLRETRNKFYAISLGLPFSIYTAQSLK